MQSIVLRTRKMLDDTYKYGRLIGTVLRCPSVEPQICEKKWTRNRNPRKKAISTAPWRRPIS